MYQGTTHLAVFAGRALSRINFSTQSPELEGAAKGSLDSPTDASPAWIALGITVPHEVQVMQS